MLSKPQMDQVASRVGNTYFQQLIGLRPPKDVYVLDGVIDVGPFTAIGATPEKRDFVLLTPASNEKNFIHETIHYSTGMGELGTRILTNVVMARAILGGRRTERGTYDLCPTCPQHNVLARLDIEPRDPKHTPKIYHYVFRETTTK